MKRKDDRCKGCIYQAKRSAPYKCDYAEITGRCRIVNGKVQSAAECTFYRPQNGEEPPRQKVRPMLT